MFIFLRLLLAHCISDFPLQFNKIYELKHKSLSGGIPHALLVALGLGLCLWPYLTNPGIWVFIYFISITHLLQDNTKLRLNSIKYSFWLYLLDQLFHVFTSATILVTKLSKMPPPPAKGNLFIQMYNDNQLVLFLIAFITVTYNALFIIKSFKLSFLKRDCSSNYTFFEVIFGMLERTCILAMLVAGGFYLAGLPLLLLLRPLVKHADKKEALVKKCFLSRHEILLSWSLACIIGLSLRIVLWKLF